MGMLSWAAVDWDECDGEGATRDGRRGEVG